MRKANFASSLLSVFIPLLLGTYLVASSASAEGGRLSRIRQGMTRTEVLIELGRPLDAKADLGDMFWTYPSSDAETCQIRFTDGKVKEAMKCDNSEKAKSMAAGTGAARERMNSEDEYKSRVNRYCGVKPIPRQGCLASMQCINGGWEENCPGVAAQKVAK